MPDLEWLSADESEAVGECFFGVAHVEFDEFAVWCCFDESFVFEFASSGVGAFDATVAVSFSESHVVMLLWLLFVRLIGRACLFRRLL